MKCTFLVHSMTHENVIQDPLYSVIGLLEQWWWEKGSQNEFLLCSAWRAPGGHVWLPPKSLVLPPKSIMPFVKQEVFRQLIQWHVGVKPENESPWNAVPSPKKKKEKEKVCAVTFCHIDQQPSNFFHWQLIWGAANSNLYGSGGKVLQWKSM